MIVFNFSLTLLKTHGNKEHQKPSLVVAQEQIVPKIYDNKLEFKNVEKLLEIKITILETLPKSMLLFGNFGKLISANVNDM